jgi:hypothetical protein
VRIDFDWDSTKAASNVSTHGVAFGHAMTVFRDPLARSILDDTSGEERWVTIGETATGNLLVVVHTWTELSPDQAYIRIISARRPTSNEARQYREDPYHEG